MVVEQLQRMNQNRAEMGSRGSVWADICRNSRIQKCETHLKNLGSPGRGLKSGLRPEKVNNLMLRLGPLQYYSAVHA